MKIVVNRKCLYLVVLLILQYQKSLSCTTDLVNTVVYEGNTASFSRENDSEAVKWQVAPSSIATDSLQDINPNDDNNVDPQFLTTYAVHSTQLIIFNSTTCNQGSMPYPTAGLYVLNYQNPFCMTGAGLTVIKSGPVCTCDAFGPSKFKLSCSVEYTNYIQQQINPIMTWTTNSGATVFQDNPPRKSLSFKNQGLQNSTSRLIIDSADTQIYECQLTFSAPFSSQPSFVDSNAPNFTSSCFISNCGLVETTTTTYAVSTTPFVINCTGQNLTNTVVYEGTLNVAFWRLNNGQSVQWQFVASSDYFNSLKTITNYDDVVVSQFNSTYAVNQSQLTIFNATVAPQGSMSYSTAGLYVVKYRNPNCTYAANLIVIRSGPVCVRDASDPNNVKLNCSVDYAESSNQPNNPYFTWKNSTSVAKQQQPVPTAISSTLKRSISQLPIASDDTTTYECQLTFSSAPKSPLNYITVTAPNFTASCFISN